MLTDHLSWIFQVSRLSSRSTPLTLKLAIVWTDTLQVSKLSSCRNLSFQYFSGVSLCFSPPFCPEMLSHGQLQIPFASRCQNRGSSSLLFFSINISNYYFLVVFLFVSVIHPNLEFFTKGKVGLLCRRGGQLPKLCSKTLSLLFRLFRG